jgi:predicted nucleic acid-binding Zn ribbon protein
MTYLATRAAGIAAVDTLDTWQGQPTLSSQLASISTLQDQVTQLTADLSTRTTERDQRQTAITAMKAAAQADKDADAANAAGQGVLDAAGGF